jgi:acyl-CoA thioesterase
MQGRSIYGGLSVAAAASLALRHRSDSRRLRLVSAQLLRPVEPGDVAGSYRPLREGRTLSFAEVQLAQKGSETTRVQMVFARRRGDALAVPDAPLWVGPDPATLPDLPYFPGITPEFTQHLALRWASGALPYAGSSEARFTGYCRFRVPAGGVEGLLGLIDAWPPPTLALLSEPAPASTVSWTAHLLEIPSSLDGWFAFAYEAVAGSPGLHTLVGRLYGPDRRLIAWSEQLSAVF